MRIALSTLCAAAMCAVSVVSQQRTPTFQASAVSVAVDVSVMRGRTPVTGLGAADFQLTDNDVPQTIDSVTLGNVPLDLTLVLDFSNSNRGDFETFARSADLQQSLRPEDRWRWLAVLAKPFELLPLRPATDPVPAIVAPGAVQATALADTLFLAMARPGEPGRRHLIVVYTDGHDSWSLLDPRRLPEIAAETDAIVYAVTTGTPPSEGRSIRSVWGTQRWRQTQKALFDSVRATGGSIHRLTSHAEALRRIVEEFRTAYVLRYTPQGVDTPGWHTLDVSVAQPRGLTVRARKGYER